MAKKKIVKEKSEFWNISYKIIRFIFMIPIYLLRGFYFLGKKWSKKSEENKIVKKRQAIDSNYEEIKKVKSYTGEFGLFEKHILQTESTIGIILGARGSGKSALALRFFENIYSKKKSKLYAMGFKKEEIPSWIEVIESVEHIKNNSYVLIDEGGILFSSRKSMSKPNKLLSDLILIARHKNLSILFISQNSSNLEVNILRQADYLFLKPSSLLQKNFERKIIKEIYIETKKDFEKYKKDKGLFYVHSDKFRGFVSNTLPSFWNQEISKAWK